MDNGGLGIILLSLAILGLAFFALGRVKHSSLFVLGCSIVLVLVSLYRIIQVVIAGQSGYPGAPTIRDGLYMVLLGSLLLLIRGLREYEVLWQSRIQDQRS